MATFLSCTEDRIECKGSKLRYELFHKQELQGNEVLSKLLNEEVSQIKKNEWKPFRNHPWKRSKSKSYVRTL